MKAAFLVGIGAALFLAGCATDMSATKSGVVSPAVDNAVALAKEGHLLAEQGQLDAALGKLEQALSLDPKLARAAFDRGQILLSKGQIQPALADLNTAVAQEPANVRYLGARCVARVVAQEQAGMADCEDALAKAEKNSRINAFISRGQANLVMKKNEAALADFKAALDENQNAMRALYGRGVARQRLGDTKGVEDQQEAVRRLPGAGREYILSQLN